MSQLDLSSLLGEYRSAQRYSMALVDDLEPEQISWRPHENSSAIGWHLGHQAAVNHYLVRNLTAAEPTFSAAFDAVFDSATPEPRRGELPDLQQIVDYREAIASSTQAIIERIDAGAVGAPEQLRLIARGLLTAVVNHEYQHATWIGEVRDSLVGEHDIEPDSGHVQLIEGYWMLLD